MATGIYLLKENGDLIEMSEHQYDSEDLLQTLLAKYPNLLAGDKRTMAKFFDIWQKYIENIKKQD